MESCIYQGKVEHVRRGSVAHRFRYSLFMVYLDLDELPGLLRRMRLLSPSRFAPASFRRSDHMGEVGTPLGESVRQLVETETGHRPTGPIRVLTQLRYWGFYFSPINMYYCLDNNRDAPQTVVAEVNNTPWGEQHCYVLWDGNRSGSDSEGRGQIQRYRHRKTFHVSPFMPMDTEYDWRLTSPNNRLGLRIQSHRAGEAIFDAAMQLRRTELSDRALAANLIRFPLHTVKIISAIYFEAFRLWLKRVPIFPHPNKLPRSQRAQSTSPATSQNR